MPMSDTTMSRPNFHIPTSPMTMTQDQIQRNIEAYQADQAKRLAANPDHVPATGPLPYTWVEPQPKEMF